MFIQMRDGVGEIDGQKCLPEFLYDLLGLIERGLRKGDDEFVAAVIGKPGQFFAK